jgi:hypothetical protein
MVVTIHILSDRTLQISWPSVPAAPLLPHRGFVQYEVGLDTPDTKTIKVKVGGRITETSVPVIKDKTARPALEARRGKEVGELADLRVDLAGHQAEHAHVESEINSIRAVASVVGLDPVLAVNILAGITALEFRRFAYGALGQVRPPQKYAEIRHIGVSGAVVVALRAAGQDRQRGIGPDYAACRPP